MPWEYKLDRVSRILYRSILRSALKFDRNPILKALVIKQSSDSAPGLQDLVCKFLGDAEFFVPGRAFNRPLKELVQRSFRFPPSHPDTDVAFAGLRYLEAITAIAHRHGLTEAAPAHQQRHVCGRFLFASTGARACQQRSLQTSSCSSSGADEGTIEMQVMAEPGMILVAHPLLTEETVPPGWFSRSTVLLCRNDLTTGSYGLCLNKPQSMDLRTHIQQQSASSMNPPSFRRIVASIMRPEMHPDLWGEDAAAPIGLTGMGLLPQVQAKLVPEQNSSTNTFKQIEDGRSYDLGPTLMGSPHILEDTDAKQQSADETDEEITAAEDWRPLLSSTPDEEGCHWAEGPPGLGGPEEGLVAHRNQQLLALSHPGRAVQLQVARAGPWSCLHQQQQQQSQQPTGQHTLHGHVGHPEVLDMFGSCRISRGGPVPGFQILHTCSKLGGVKLVSETVSSPPLLLGGDLRQAKELVRRKELRCRDVCLFDGECVWHPQQLEQELANGLWLLLRMPPGQLLDHLPDRKGRKKEYKQVGRGERIWRSLVLAGGELAPLARISQTLAEEIHALDIS